MRSQHRAVREVVEVCEGDLITSEVLVLLEESLVTSKLALEGCRQVLDKLLVGGLATHWGEDTLVSDGGGIEVEVGELNGRGRLEGCDLLEVTSGEEGRASLGGDVAGDRAGFENGETVIVLYRSGQMREGKYQMYETYEVRDLAEGLLGKELGRFVLSFAEVNRHQLVGSVGLLQSSQHTLGACRVGGAVEFQDHGCRVWV